LLSVHRDATQEEKVISNKRIFEEFSLSHKIKQRVKGKAHHGDIGPVLMLGQDDHRPVIRNNTFPFCLNPIKKGENQLGNPFGHAVDEGIPVHLFLKSLPASLLQREEKQLPLF
jgi:hypothetical protein